MKVLNIIVFILLITLILLTSIREVGVASRIEVIDTDLNELVDSTAQLEVIGVGYQWAEGPVWVEEHQFLLFSDIPTNTLYKWKEGEGVTQYLKPSGYTGEIERGGQKGGNGLIIGNDGSLILAQHGDRRIARMNAPLTSSEPVFVTIADSFDQKKLNTPNDLVQHSNGGIYFTDPPYGFEEKGKDPAQQLSFQGVYYFTPSGELYLVTDKMSRPNGIALSPDEKTLYVSNSDRDHPVWMAFDVEPNGRTSNGRIFKDATGVEGPGIPDGMDVDSAGNIYAAGPGGIWIMNPEAKVLGRIRTQNPISNCTIGNNGKVLYITAGDKLLRLKLK